MKRYTLLRDFLRMGNMKFLDKSRHILTLMTNNAAFPNPTPGMNVLSNGIEAFSAAHDLAKLRDLVKIDLRDQLRTELEQVLLKLKEYVAFTADGDLAKLRSSGYTVSSGVSTPSEVVVVTGVKVVQGKNSGELDISLPTVDGAESYEFCIAEMPVQNDQWRIKTKTRIRHTFTGLIRGKEYAVKVGAVGTNDITIYSDPIYIIVN